MSDEQERLDVAKARAAAIVAKDAEAIGRFMIDDWLCAHTQITPVK